MAAPRCASSTAATVPYVTDGTTNASLPKGSAPEALTMEQAVELMNARAGTVPSGRRRPASRGRSEAAAPKRVKSATTPKATKLPSAKRAKNA